MKDSAQPATVFCSDEAPMIVSTMDLISNQMLTPSISKQESFNEHNKALNELKILNYIYSFCSKTGKAKIEKELLSVQKNLMSSSKQGSFFSRMLGTGENNAKLTALWRSLELKEEDYSDPSRNVMHLLASMKELHQQWFHYYVIQIETKVQVLQNRQMLPRGQVQILPWARAWGQ